MKSAPDYLAWSFHAYDQQGINPFARFAILVEVEKSRQFGHPHEVRVFHFQGSPIGQPDRERLKGRKSDQITNLLQHGTNMLPHFSVCK